MAFFIWLEGTALSIWLRESPSLWAFPFVLFLHTLGLGLLVGVNVAINLWLANRPAEPPGRAISQLFIVMWFGFWINAASGILLLVAYPAKALTNPVFYIKMVLIGAGVVCLQWIRNVIADNWGALGEELASRRVRGYAVAGVFIWIGAIFAGRLLAYTHSILMASDRFY